jgi:2'-5' RNA ligase
MNTLNKIRCFVSLEIPQSFIKYATQIQEDIQNVDYLNAKYTKPSNLHLTLKFLGKISQAKVEKTLHLLSDIEFIPFTIKIEQLGVFSRQKINIVWLKVNGVNELQKKIDFALNTEFPEEDRFMGHITIARVKRVLNRTALLDYLDNLGLLKKSESSEMQLDKMKMY